MLNFQILVIRFGIPPLQNHFISFSFTFFQLFSITKETIERAYINVPNEGKSLFPSSHSPPFLFILNQTSHSRLQDKKKKKKKGEKLLGTASQLPFTFIKWGETVAASDSTEEKANASGSGTPAC